MKKLLIILVWFSTLLASAQQQTISTTGTVTIGPEFAKINANFTELYDTVGILEDSITALRANISTLQNEISAQQAIDETSTETLNLNSYRTFSKSIGSSQQFEISNETTGDVFDIFCASGSGSLNATLFYHDSKTVTAFVTSTLTYDNSKAALISVKILKTTGSEITIAYFINQL